MLRSICLCMVVSVTPAFAGELRFVGELGNSGGAGASHAVFDGDAAAGMGPVLDAQPTIWERGGATRLNRYALDGRQLASFEIPKGSGRIHDQMALAGDHLVMWLGKALYRLPVSAPSLNRLA